MTDFIVEMITLGLSKALYVLSPVLIVGLAWGIIKIFK
jgi:flagellar biosynthesis protein FliQ